MSAIFETVMNIVSGSPVIYGSISAAILGYFLKTIPTKHIKMVVGKFAYGLGCTVTLGLSKFAYTAPLWNKTIEPFFVDLIDNVVGTFTAKFIEGLRSDDKK